MGQAADFGELHDLPRCGRRDGPEVGCILVQGEMGARLVVVAEVPGQDAVEVSLAEDQHVIQAFAPDRAVSRSANGFCHGLCGAVRISAMPMPFTRWRNRSPNT